jgi:diguanylate cyclase (GGDEF)-like protein
MIDPLTGIPGRGRFWELAGVLERESRSDGNLGLAVMFIDLDGFKQVNDTFGHDQGDWLLRDLAVILRESVRDTDVIGRLGGDEFAVCLTGRCGHLVSAAASIAERIVGKVRELGEGIGCSIGVSVCENGSPDLSRALTLADQAMYEAKRLGKNRYIVREDATQE